MARDWRDLFIVDGPAPAEAAPAAETEQRRGGMFRRLRENLRKTRQALTSEIQATLFEELNDETWERLEEALIYADVGARTTAEVVQATCPGCKGVLRIPAAPGLGIALDETALRRYAA